MRPSTSGACEMPVDVYLYFHSPCFDGIVSAVLTWDYLESARSCKIPRLCPVDYDLRSQWLSTQLHVPSAVVDFLYHPQTCFWADHHSTTFLNEEVKKDYEIRKEESDNCFLIYQSKSGSCSKLLWHYLYKTFKHRNHRYRDLVEWADKIDAARYDSVEEAIFGDAPALLIYRSLGGPHGKEFSERLVRELRHCSVDEVAQLPEVKERSRQVMSLTKAGLNRIEKSIRLDKGDIAVFDVDSRDVNINRYAPYYFYPQARYSVGIVRTADRAKITAMRNPWLEFQSVNLGGTFEKFGGGGHERVASVLLPERKVKEADSILTKVVDMIRNESVESLDIGT